MKVTGYAIGASCHALRGRLFAAETPKSEPVPVRRWVHVRRTLHTAVPRVRHPDRRGSDVVLRPVPGDLVDVSALQGHLPGTGHEAVHPRDGQRHTLLPV